MNIKKQWHHIAQIEPHISIETLIVIVSGQRTLQSDPNFVGVLNSLKHLKKAACKFFLLIQRYDSKGALNSRETTCDIPPSQVSLVGSPPEKMVVGKWCLSGGYTTFNLQCYQVSAGRGSSCTSRGVHTWRLVIKPEKRTVCGQNENFAHRSTAI